jgi:PAS domain S-box-containing protein
MSLRDGIESSGGREGVAELVSILIVEDESLIALELKKKLEEVGYTVATIVDNALDALLSVERLRPDLVLLDIRLRGPVDGIETGDRIRRQFQIPVIFVTAHADRETLDRARTAAPFGYLVKPFRDVNFRAPIEMALQRHKMERELQDSETRLLTRADEKTALLDAAPNAVIVIGPDGLMNLVNTQTEKLFGYSREELLGQPVEMLIPARFRPNHASHRSAFFAAPSPRSMGAGRDLFGLHKDGTEIPCEIGLNPIATADGQCVVTSIVDLTERFKAQETLRLLVEAAPNAMILIAPDGLMSLVNTQTEKLFGYSRGELLGKSIEMLIPERFRPNHADYRSAFLVASATRSMGAGRDLFGLCKDGTEIPCEIGLNPIFTADGQCVVASIVDVTGHITAQKTLRRSLAEMTTLMKEVHLGVKNNLQVICGLLSMQIACLEDSSSSGPLTDAHLRVLAMSLIHEQIYHSETLADLDFGEYIRVLSGRLFSAYCVNRPGIRLELSVETVYLNVNSAIPCGLILNELLSNSLKHAFRGDRAGVIRVTLKNIGSDYVEVTVADNGIGLPADFSIENSRSLGLRVVDSLIHQLRAHLVIAGEGGATFRFGWRTGE